MDKPLSAADIDDLGAAYARLEIGSGTEWFALISKQGYDLCLEQARYQPGQENSGPSDVIGRFACGGFAIKCLPVVAQVLNALPRLLASARVGVDGWQPIETAPKDGTAVLVYFADVSFDDMEGQPADWGDLRDHVERTDIGFYEGDIWHEQGTAHDMFESWRDKTQFPTHWRPLPEPPQDPSHD